MDNLNKLGEIISEYTPQKIKPIKIIEMVEGVKIVNGIYLKCGNNGTNKTES